MVGGRPAPNAVETVLGHAMRLMHAGKTAEAEEALRKARSMSPGHAEAAHLHGLLCLQNDRAEEAVKLLGRASRAAPDRADIWLHLATALATTGNAEEAEAALRRVLELEPEDRRARFNLGVVLSRAGRLADAIATLSEAAKAYPEPDAYAELGAALGRSGRHREASEAFRAGLALAPDDARLRRNLSRAYAHVADELERLPAAHDVILAHVRTWLELDPTEPVALHMLAAYGGAAPPARCSDAYVRSTFDQFAASFDTVLAELQYSGIEHTVEALRAAWGDRAELDLLDAGCGTGALAPAVRERCRRLVGVDLSPRMIARCEARGGYDALEVAELTAYLSAHPASFDAVACADTVIYFGDVAPLFTAAIGALRPDGVFVFTAEALEDAEEADAGAEEAKEDAPFRLTPFGRYAHRQTYLEDTLRAAGASVEQVTRVASIRKERQVPIPALVVTARRPPA